MSVHILPLQGSWSQQTAESSQNCNFHFNLRCTRSTATAYNSVYNYTQARKPCLHFQLHSDRRTTNVVSAAKVLAQKPGGNTPLISAKLGGCQPNRRKPNPSHLSRNDLNLWTAEPNQLSCRISSGKWHLACGIWNLQLRRWRSALEPQVGKSIAVWPINYAQPGTIRTQRTAALQGIQPSDLWVFANWANDFIDAQNKWIDFNLICVYNT